MKPLDPQSIRNIGAYGLIRQSSVDDYLMPEGAVSDSINFHFDRIGVSTTRPGIMALGGTVKTNFADSSPEIVGIHNALGSAILVFYYDSSDDTTFKIRTPDRNNADTWFQTVQGPHAGAGFGVKIRCVDFLNYTLVIPSAIEGAYSSMHFSTWPFTGAASINSPPLNIHNFMDGGGVSDRKYATFGEVYKSRLYLAGDKTYRSRLFFSSVPSFPSTSPGGLINWTPTTDWVDVNNGDGEEISALKRFSLELLVFKPNYIYRFRTSGLDPDPLIRVGTRSNESVIEGKKGIYFHHDTGFYRYSGGYPEEISRPIADIVDNIPFSQREDIVSWKDSDHIYWSLAGNVTVPGAKESETFRNAVLRYTESSDVWTLYSYARPVKAAAPYFTKVSSSSVVGFDNAVVALMNRGTTDVGEPIKYRLSTKWYELEGIENSKFIEKMMAIAEKGMGMTVMYQTDDYNDWITLSPDLRKLATLFPKGTDRFNRIRFRISGITSIEPSTFLGFKIISGTNEGVIKK